MAIAAPATMAVTSTAAFQDVATAPIEILTAQVAMSLSIPARDAQDLLKLACAILHERPSRVAVLDHGRLTDNAARLLADAAAELEA